MTLEELLKHLGGLQDGQKLVDALKEIIAAKDIEVKTKSKAAKDAQTALKDAQEKEKTANARLTTVLEHFEIDADSEDLEEAIEATKAKLQTAKEGGAPSPEVSALQKQIAKLEKDLKKTQTLNTDTQKLFEEERGKRHAGMKTQALLAALVENKSIKPEQLVKLLQDRVKVGDDDALVFVGDDGDDIVVKDGVKAFLTANPEFMVNNQVPGAGSGGVGGNGTKSTFAEALLKSNETTERLQQAESHYFGGSNK